MQVHKKSLLLTFLSLQVQNSPLKTLLEIIVKHHIKGLKNDKMTCNESDPLESAPIVSSIANCPAVAPTIMNGTKTEDSAAAFVISKHVKTRYVEDVLMHNSVLK